MDNEDKILDASLVYSEEEVLNEFQASCEAEAEAPGEHQERLRRAAADLCQMLGRRAGLAE